MLNAKLTLVEFDQIVLTLIKLVEMIAFIHRISLLRNHALGGKGVGGVLANAQPISMNIHGYRAETLNRKHKLSLTMNLKFKEVTGKIKN